ncbi:40S ribosomal protein S27 [Basidiobolus ranarum]|uniref:1,3-beta-glucanosyltransferase n=1 Tax=Basidiobolus ranarum TaxID=34480 RepID=A0ABR2WWL9_9FUNG
MRVLSVLSAISLVYISSASALNPIVIKGHKFFDSVTKNEFYIKGVAYQPRGGARGTSDDPLANPVTCKRDIENFKDLGLNTIRVYQVDHTLNHDECMKALEDAGIYLVLDIATPTYSINRKDPEYDIDLLDNYKKTADAFAKYNNVLGFFAGNEVPNDIPTTSSSPFVKAVIRDMKAYMRTKPRYIPIGYSTNDDADIRLDIAHYFNCGDDSERADFYGYNIYSWCGDQATFQSSGFADRTKEYADYSIPIFLSEYGCNTSGVRSFHEVKSIYGPDMEDTFSGGIVYEYSQEDNNYGLVNISSSGEVTKRPDYDNYKNALSAVSPKVLNMDTFSADPNRKPSQCPQVGAAWKASTKLPSTPSEDVCKCMTDTLKCAYSSKPTNSTTVDVGKLFSWLCGEASCDAISSNGETGTYGVYSTCDTPQRLSYMFNQYYTKNGEKETVCNFDGLSAVVTPSKQDTTNCARLAGTQNQNNKVPHSSAISLTISSTSSLFITLYLVLCLF